MTTNINPFKFYFGYVIILIILILSLALAHKSKAQQNKWLRIERGAGAPIFNPASPAPATGYLFLDTLSGNWYESITGTSWKIATYMNALKGKDGITPMFQTGTTTTVSYDTPAKIQIRIVSPNTYAIDAWIPQGQPGKDGTGGSATWTVNPDNLGACHCTSGADKQALITAFRNAQGKEVPLYGEYWVDGTILIDKYVDVNQTGSAIIHCLNNNFSPVIGRPQPTDINDANKYCLYRAHFNNIVVSMATGTNQVGFDMKAGQNIYDYCSAVGGLWGARSEFQLKAVYNHFNSLSCTNGIYIGIGTFPGATKDNAQSNGVLLESPYSHTVSNTALYIDASYETDIRGMVVEGNGSIQYGLYYNMQNSTTAKNGSLNFFHGEQTGGCTGAWIYVNMGNGSISLDNIICHYPGLIVDGQSSNSTGVTEVGYFNYGVGDANGKYFNSHGTMNYVFFLCYSFYPSVVTTRFVAPAPVYCSGYTVSSVFNPITTTITNTMSWSGCSGNTFQLVTSR